MTTTTRLGALTGDYVLDTVHTRIWFVARHVMVSKVRGQFDEFEGNAHLDGEKPSKSSAELRIQAKSIQTGNAQRDEQLRGNDFLDIPNHPTITFTSTKVEQVGESDFEVTGAEHDPWGNFRVGFEGKVTINRKDWGVSWNAALEGGGVLISEKVTLEFDVAAIRQP